MFRVFFEVLSVSQRPNRHSRYFLFLRSCHPKLPAFTLKTRLVRTDGSAFWCQVTPIRFPDGEQELGCTLLEDISDRKALELSLKRLYDAQETILHLVTHNLKAPTGHIQLLTDLLERQVQAATFATDNVEDSAQYLALIRQACTNANKLLQDVLLIGSLDGTKLKLYPTDPGTWLKRRMATHQLAARGKGLALALDVPTLAVKANLNADAFGRVVDNLVSNALKFTPAGGALPWRYRKPTTGCC